MELTLAVLVVLIAVAVAAWLVIRRVERLVRLFGQSACPMQDVADRLADIDRTLEIHEQRTRTAETEVVAARRAVAEVAAARSRDAAIAAAKPIEQVGFGGRL